MKLTHVHITEFQSIRDSNPFEIGDTTCLVGKTEAGKTALLKALYRHRRRGIDERRSGDERRAA
jgi:predicted ATP-dependent endonuclease of OLD family